LHFIVVDLEKWMMENITSTQREQAGLSSGFELMDDKNP
jgi:hypothetical protein